MKKICNNDNKSIVFRPYTLNDYKNFMVRRTFCIGGRKPDKSYDVATAWIVDKVNRNDDGDYKYLIATNLHVCSDISDYGNGENKDYVFCISEDIVNLKNNANKTK